MSGSLNTAILTGLLAVNAILLIREAFLRRLTEKRVSIRYRVVIEYAIALGSINSRATRFLKAMQDGDSFTTRQDFASWQQFRSRRERELQDEEASL
ncbi:hypothetical protein MRS76_03200 [Rhizobiaceae bacterium n13]|uniref:Uncharacterized protein n=1 Tax=Ferirhizobium litorale TaxID=2927786 RepID=A0AAE3QA04_9HYPH|nr:hypothetical protein [Fererhizobium litorale]MDI7860952.1 hypothetical protein [Fererhizobium litorale]MDI7921100.1 hypothetical protein [Fererhizobium litorale]